MSKPNAQHIVVIGAGAAGLMAARELARAGRRVTLLEARDRCGGRIYPLPNAEFGYAAEGGAEFVHGEAPVTHGLLREAGLKLLPIQGTPRTIEDGEFLRRDVQAPHQAELQKALQDLTEDLTVAEFLRRHFASPLHGGLRRSIERMAEGYDAADPERASTLALRDEWMDGGNHAQGRIIGGYGALVEFLTAECRHHAVAIYLGAAVSAIEATDGGVLVRCANGDAHTGDAVILTVPLPLLPDRASSGGTREGRGGCQHRLRECHQDPAAVRDRLVARPAKGPRRSDVPVVGCEDPGLVDAASRRSSGPYGLVRRPEDGIDGQPRRTSISARRVGLDSGNLRRRFKTSGPEAGRSASDQLGP